MVGLACGIVILTLARAGVWPYGSLMLPVGPHIGSWVEDVPDPLADGCHWRVGVSPLKDAEITRDGT